MPHFDATVGLLIPVSPRTCLRRPRFPVEEFRCTDSLFCFAPDNQHGPHAHTWSPVLNAFLVFFSTPNFLFLLFCFYQNPRLGIKEKCFKNMS